MATASIYKLTSNDFEFITIADRLSEVFISSAFDFNSSDHYGEKYNSEILEFLTIKMQESNGIWHISSHSFEDELHNEFVSAGIFTELYVSIDTKNQIVTTLDYGGD